MKDDFNQPADPALIFKNFMYVGILFAGLCTIYMPCIQKAPEKGNQSPGTEVTASCEPLCRCWDLNLNQQPMPLTGEPVPQPKTQF